MATVYLARGLKHGRQVALKVLRPELGSILGPDRFSREIQVAAALNHPHILPLYDSGTAGRRGSGEDHEEMSKVRYVSYHMEHASSVYGIKGSFLFTALHSHPRFVALLRKLNLKPPQSTEFTTEAQGTQR